MRRAAAAALLLSVLVGCSGDDDGTETSSEVRSPECAVLQHIVDLADADLFDRDADTRAALQELAQYDSPEAETVTAALVALSSGADNASELGDEAVELCGIRFATPTATTATATMAPATAAPTSSAAVPTTSTVAQETTTTTEPDPALEALELAQQLGDAFASGDWATARHIAPIPERTDEEYAEGFAPLEEVVIWPAASEISRTVVRSWFLQVAHEVRDGQDQTAYYCVHWDVDLASQTIALVHGNELGRIDGVDFSPNHSFQALLGCINFDGEAAGGAPQPIDVTLFGTP